MAGTRWVIAVVSRNRSAVRLDPVTDDRYGRTVAAVWAGQIELSCYGLRECLARYIAKYDAGGRIARAVAAIRW